MSVRHCLHAPYLRLITQLENNPSANKSKRYVLNPAPTPFTKRLFAPLAARVI
jgi:hypothetical protein